MTTVRTPLDKPWLAFPELRALTEPEARRFVARAQRRRPWSMVGATLLALFAMVAGWALLAGAWSVLSRFIGDRQDTGPMLAMMTLAAALLAGPACGLLARDAWIKRIIRREIESARCSLCGLVHAEGGGCAAPPDDSTRESGEGVSRAG
ncbi:MAG: hypothetical protein KF745_06000 [Phycisphaeraceae bacterium]|nr:hypothetical protein [Phycisphaeraceae bacterium]